MFFAIFLLSTAVAVLVFARVLLGPQHIITELKSCVTVPPETGSFGWGCLPQSHGATHRDGIASKDVSTLWTQYTSLLQARIYPLPQRKLT